MPMDSNGNPPRKPSPLHTLPLRYSPAPCRPEDTLVPGLSDEDSDGTRRRKRLRREVIGQEYLSGRGEHKFILTARLKGPFEGQAWRNPWAKKATPKARKISKHKQQDKRPEANSKRKREGAEIPTIDRTREAEKVSKKVRREEQKVSQRGESDKTWLSSNVHRVRPQRSGVSGLMSPTPERQHQLSVAGPSKIDMERNPGGLLLRGPEGSFVSPYERPAQPDSAEIESDDETSTSKSKKRDRQDDNGESSDEGSLDMQLPDTKPRVERRVLRKRIHEIDNLLKTDNGKKNKSLALEKGYLETRIVDLTAEIRAIARRRNSPTKKRGREEEVDTPKEDYGGSTRRKKQKMSFSEDKVVLPTPLKGDLPISNQGKEIANARKVDERLPGFIYSSSATPEDPDDPLFKPRCQRCRQQKKWCDKKSPCLRCLHAGIGEEGCIYEERQKAKAQEAVKRLKVITEHGMKQKEEQIVVATEDLLSLINGSLKPQDQTSDTSEESINTAWQRDHAKLFSASDFKPTVPKRKLKIARGRKTDLSKEDSLVAVTQSVEDIIDQALGLSPSKGNGVSRSSRSMSRKSAETNKAAGSIALLQPSAAPVTATSCGLDLLGQGRSANGGASSNASSSNSTPILPAQKSSVPEAMATAIIPAVKYPALHSYQSFVPEAMAGAVARASTSTNEARKPQKPTVSPGHTESKTRSDLAKVIARSTPLATAQGKARNSESTGNERVVSDTPVSPKKRRYVPGGLGGGGQFVDVEDDATSSAESLIRPIPAITKMAKSKKSKVKPSRKITKPQNRELNTPVPAKASLKRRISFTPGGNIKQAVAVQLPSVSFENYESIPSSSQDVEILREIQSSKSTFNSNKDPLNKDKSMSGGDVQPEAQVPALPQDPSGPSTNAMETDKQSLKFVSSEEGDSTAQFSTQAELAKAQKNLQGDLQSPNKQPNPSTPTEEPHINAQTDGSPDLDVPAQTPIRIPDLPFTESTQAMIDNLSPFADSTAKKPSSFLHALTRPAAAILDYVGWGSQIPSEQTSPEQAGQLAEPLLPEDNPSLETAEGTVAPSALALRAEAPVVYPQISFEEVVLEMQTSSDVEDSSLSRGQASSQSRPAHKSQPPPLHPSKSTEEDKIVYDCESDEELARLPTSSKRPTKGMRALKLPPEKLQTRLASPIRMLPNKSVAPAKPNSVENSYAGENGQRQSGIEPPGTDDLGITQETYDHGADATKPTQSSNNALDKLSSGTQRSLFRPSQNRQSEGVTKSALSTPRPLITSPRPTIPASSMSRQIRNVKATPQSAMSLRSDKSVEARDWDGAAERGDTPRMLDEAKSFLGAVWDVEGEVRKMSKRR